MGLEQRIAYQHFCNIEWQAFSFWSPIAKSIQTWRRLHSAIYI